MSPTNKQKAYRFARMAAWVGPLPLYLVFAWYLLFPYRQHLDAWGRSLPWVLGLGAWGGFCLAMPQVRSFTAALLCGALYGFGPLVLYMARFHLCAVAAAAAVPWSLMPWALARRSRPWLRWPLLALPFVGIAGGFKILDALHLFVLPVSAGRVSGIDWGVLIAPLLKAGQGRVLLGLYHVAVGLLIPGVVRLVKSGPRELLWPLGLGCLAAVWNPVFEVSPLVWLAIPQAVACVYAGLGVQALQHAGARDRGWVLAACAALVILAVTMLMGSGRCFQVFMGLGAPYARLLVLDAKLYLLGSAALAGIYGLSRLGLGWVWPRMALICAVLGLDLWVSAGCVVGTLFC